MVRHFVSICDRWACEFGPSPRVSNADSIDLRNHQHLIYTPTVGLQKQAGYLHTGSSFGIKQAFLDFRPPWQIDGKERLVPETQESLFKSLRLEVKNKREKTKQSHI